MMPASATLGRHRQGGPRQMAWLGLALPSQRREIPWLGWRPRGIAASCGHPGKDRPSAGHAHLLPP